MLTPHRRQVQADLATLRDFFASDQCASRLFGDYFHVPICRQGRVNQRTAAARRTGRPTPAMSRCRSSSTRSLRPTFAHAHTPPPAANARRISWTGSWCSYSETSAAAWARTDPRRARRRRSLLLVRGEAAKAAVAAAVGVRRSRPPARHPKDDLRASLDRLVADGTLQRISAVRYRLTGTCSRTRPAPPALPRRPRSRRCAVST